MTTSLLFGTALALVLIGSAVTGTWRLVFFPLRIRPRAMNVAKLGLAVAGEEDRRRIDSILGAFASGFNAMLTSRTQATVWAQGYSLSPLLQPFAHEGVAMGYVPRQWFRFDPVRFERDLVRGHGAFKYLYYVGLGFWSGVRKAAPARVKRTAEGLDPLYRYLVFDGFGFSRAFFDRSEDVETLAVLYHLEGYTRNAAFQGVGRAWWFRYMDDVDRLIDRIESLGPYAADAAAGVGLAVAFVNPDRLERACDFARRLPESWRPHVQLGLCFALKARLLNDVDALNHWLSSTTPERAEAVYASIRECDRVELLVRADGQPHAYRRWRESVTAWMVRHVKYPLDALFEPRSGDSGATPSGTGRADRLWSAGGAMSKEPEARHAAPGKGGQSRISGGDRT